MSKKRARPTRVESDSGPYCVTPATGIVPVLVDCVAEAGRTYGEIVAAPTTEIPPATAAEAARVTEQLALRFMHRCSLFAMHRTKTTPETMEESAVVLLIEDAEMGWKTLAMDAGQ